IYRPNQTVQFRVVHRSELGQKLIVKPGEKMWVEIRDPKGNKVYDKLHTVGDFGSTSGSIVMGDEPALGEYTILTRSETEDANLHQWNWQWMGRWGKQAWNGVRFRVDEYRKPEYKVDIGFKKKTVLQGDDVEATIDAKYYFGSPVTDAEVAYTVTRRGYWYYWRCWDFYYDWYTEDEDGSDEIYEGKGGRRQGRRAPRDYGEQVLSGTGKTNAEGKLIVKFTSQKWTHDAVYDIHAQVTDLSRRVVEGGGSCKATRAEFGLAVSLNKYVYKPGDKVNVRVRATTADDKVVADQKVVVKGYDRHWRNGNHQDTFLFEGSSKTDEHGIAEFNFTPDREGGYLWLVVEAEDRKANKVTAEQWVWLCGNNWYGDTVNLNGIDLILDKKTYNIGDTAQILVTSQYKNVTFLFTVEGKEIHQHQVVSLKGHTKLIEFKIDSQVLSPNVHISVAAIKENQFVQKSKMVVVNPSEKFIKVEIRPDKTQYRPRNKARYEIVTTGADGKPVAAEVAFGVVDESIYALQDEYAPDIRKHFIHRRGIEVATSNSLQYHDYGRADEKRKANEQGAGGALFAADAAKPAAPATMRAAKSEAKEGEKDRGGATYAATEIRSNFADTMVWRTVTTGADGRTVVEVDIPDNLTTWKATARAVTADSRFGQELGSVVCRKEMIVRLQTPRFFTQNDQTVISAVAHNYLDGEKEVKIELAVEGIDVAGEMTQFVKVPAGGQQRIDWKATVKTAGRAKVTVKALSDVDSDAMQLVVPVLAHGAMKWDSRAGIVGDKVIEKIMIPDGTVKGGSELMICVSPTHAAMVLDALEYLAGYPYGCVEQTMSRFLPTVVVSQALQKLGLSKPELKAEIPEMVASGLQRLYNFQQQDGGWGWWQHDKSNAWTTAYVMTGLALAREADHMVAHEVFSRGLQSLHAHLASNQDANTQAYLLYALRMSGGRDDVTRARLTDKLGELNAYSKALLALVLKKDGMRTNEVLESLAREAKVVGGSAHFDGGDKGGWMDHHIEVSA
ncbi:MAG: hypothetical protein EHM91_04020, partial [Planctomycetota bacterium]